MGFKSASFVSMAAAADFLGPGAIETNRYQAEITDLVRRRFAFGQRISSVPATGQPSRYFEQLAIPTAAFVDPRVITATATQPQRVERTAPLKALTAQINYSIFDVEVNQQQGQFAYLEAKDLNDAVNAVLRQHDISLWSGSDTDMNVPTTTQYFGISGQIVTAPTIGSFGPTATIASNASLVDGFKTTVAQMASRQDFEVRPTAIYLNPLLSDLFDQEAKSVQLYFNEVEVIPGVIVKALPTAVGLLPLIPDAGLNVLASMGGQNQYTAFIVQEDMIEYHYLTTVTPRVFQLGLLSNLAGQFLVIKFGAVVAKGSSYSHRAVICPR